MRALVMGEEQRRALAELRRRAEAEPISLYLQFEALGTREPVGRAFTIMLPMGYCVTFTIDHQADGYYRHLSVSVDGRRGMIPNQYAMGWIAEELGFKPLEMKSVYLENESAPHPAVNWLQKC